MQIVHTKNTAYYLPFPMIDKASPEVFKSAEAVTATAYYKDGAGNWTSLTIAGAVSEIGTTGVYEIDLAAGEMNHDKVLVKMTAANSADTAFLFDMGSIAAQVLDEASADHRVTGSIGEAVHHAKAFFSNKRILYHAQSNKLEVYDDDGSTLLYTMTPTADTANNLTTITPS